MHTVLVKILKPGASVINVTNELIIVRESNGSVILYQYFFDEEGLPRLNNERRVKITFGDGTIEVVKKIRRMGDKKNADKQDNEITVGTF